ncbi:hypothetical protein DUHN55_36650 [Helicobacter pylori]
MSRRLTPFVLALPIALGGCGIGSSIAGVHDAPAERSDGASITTTTATKVATRVVADVAGVSLAEDDTRLRKELLSGPALREIEAVVTSKDVSGRSTATPKDLEVLAVSRGTDWPRAVLATSRTGDVQHLYVLVAQSADRAYTLFADVPMAAGASVPALPPVEEGAAVKLSSAPEQDVTSAANAWAKGVAFPASKKSSKEVSVGDGFSQALKKNAAKTKEDLGDLGYYAQRQTVAKGETVSFELADGGAITFLPMTRTDTIRATNKLKELKVREPALKYVLDASTVERALSVKHVETLALVTPEQGKARVVGASEVVASAAGS